MRVRVYRSYAERLMLDMSTVDNMRRVWGKLSERREPEARSVYDWAAMMTSDMEPTELRVLGVRWSGCQKISQWLVRKR
jgi:hypothetical protein